MHTAQRKNSRDPMSYRFAAVIVLLSQSVRCSARTAIPTKILKASPKLRERNPTTR